VHMTDYTHFQLGHKHEIADAKHYACQDQTVKPVFMADSIKSSMELIDSAHVVPHEEQALCGIQHDKVTGHCQRELRTTETRSAPLNGVELACCTFACIKGFRRGHTRHCSQDGQPYEQMHFEQLAFDGEWTKKFCYLIFYDGNNWTSL
jgi:hypothetical protein